MKKSNDSEWTGSYVDEEEEDEESDSVSNSEQVVRRKIQVRTTLN